MLVEISCEKFIDAGVARAPITFSKGLNVVLGTETGTNSIGKSTFLLILDFVFGGEDYLTKASDVHSHVGRHVIKFVFEFGGVRFYFSRDTQEPNAVKVYDEGWAELATWSLTNYRQFLKEKYLIRQGDVSFREAVSRYIRVYQRENLDEKHPLSLFRGESEKTAVYELLKLFGAYEKLRDIAEAVDRAAEEYSLYTKSIKHDFVPAMTTKKEFKNSESRLEALRAEQAEFDDPEKLKGKSAEELVKVANLKSRLQILRAQKSRAENKRDRIVVNRNCEPGQVAADFDALKEFFPSVAIKKIVDIENFHRELTKILKTELESEYSAVCNKIADLDRDIQSVETELGELDAPTGVSPRMLKTYAEKDREIKVIEERRENYTRKVGMKEGLDTLRQQLEDRERAVRVEVQQAVSAKMEEKNDVIYDGKRKAPYLILEKSGYSFVTPDDTGTGTAYKSLLVYDLSVLELTNLPFLIHDSVLLRQIADAPVEKILRLYQTAGKQIFISFDKANSYSNEAERILNECARIRLAGGSHSLFGRSWGEKDSDN